VSHIVECRREDIGEYVLLCGDPNRVPKIAKYFDKARVVSNIREFKIMTGFVDGVKVSAASTGIGCPSAVMLVEVLCKLGAHTFIRVGTSGSLQKFVKIGDLVIATAAVRDEGTTKTYVPPEYPAVAHHDVILALINAANRIGIRYHVGIVHTKDAFYVEHPEFLPQEEKARESLKVWERAGVLATEMECSGIFIISSLRRARAGAILAVVGSTIEGRPIVNEKVGVNEAIAVAIEAIKILSKR